MQNHTPARRDEEPSQDGADRQRSVSIFDVAKAAGVSHQTVSRVVNGSPKVRKATRERVLQVIDELGYKPNRLARALAGGVVRSVTVLTSDTILYGASLALRGIEEAARAADFAVSVSVLDENSPLTPDDVAGRLARPGEPVLVIAFNAPGERVWRALPAEFPAAAVVERPHEAGQPGGRPEAWLDDRAAAAQATRYLLGLGHRTVHYMTIPSSTTRVGQRAEGWRDTLSAAGRPVPEPLEGGWSPRSGYLAARSVVADLQVTAVLCGNDDLALGVLRAAREAGREVPGDLSVMGFDDAPYAAYTHPTLTTVRLDFEGLGRGAFGMLHRLLDPDNAPAPALWAEPELIVRESTGPAPHRPA
ncbi:LacI family DNA-binding transcriptional regulator [Streptomyces sp. DG2A-72]|uniref:LacI family DNA-binding transcriptional regulator n=1 Tax=Streptomyces sp. DG2A-72 TaxID=3051386 RepID=UPI00265B8BBC|nr:LacI family DNA-binding transcriptional regulator [Streptomyces sp. DG2A-72]MDO0930333.1 LacI family DNA-binding transcriptional regulator [Streptomyces sp. DG2A-72]